MTTTRQFEAVAHSVRTVHEFVFELANPVEVEQYGFQRGTNALQRKRAEITRVEVEAEYDGDGVLHEDAMDITLKGFSLTLAGKRDERSGCQTIVGDGAAAESLIDLVAELARAELVNWIPAQHKQPVPWPEVPVATIVVCDNGLLRAAEHGAVPMDDSDPVNGDEPERDEPVIGSPGYWAAKRVEAVEQHATGGEVRLSLLEGSDVSMMRWLVTGWSQLGRLVNVEDYGHDRSLRFTFDGSGVDTVVCYMDGYTKVQNGIVREPEHSGWAGD